MFAPSVEEVGEAGQTCDTLDAPASRATPWNRRRLPPTFA